MYFYCLKATKNYKDIFKLMRAVEIKHFNKKNYFYYIDNGINPLTIIVNLNKVLSIIKEG